MSIMVQYDKMHECLGCGNIMSGYEYLGVQDNKKDVKFKFWCTTIGCVHYNKKYIKVLQCYHYLEDPNNIEKPDYEYESFPKGAMVGVLPEDRLTIHGED